MYFAPVNKLLFHIGFHKTGTSWLQENLFHENNEFFKPVNPIPSGHSELARRFFYDHNKQVLNSFEEYPKLKDNESAKSILDSGDGRILVVSNERLSGNPHSGGFDSKLIADRIYNYYSNSKILVVFREQHSFIISSYFQYLFEGGTGSLKKYVNKLYDGRIPLFSKNNLKYHLLVEYYQKKFGKDQVLALPFEFFSQNKKEFIKHLSEFLEVEISCNDELFNRAVNKRSNHLLMYKTRWLNYFTHRTSVNNYSPFKNKITAAGATVFRKLLSKTISQEKDKKFRRKLKTEMEQLVGDYYTETNRQLSELTGFKLSELGYR